MKDFLLIFVLSISWAVVYFLLKSIRKIFSFILFDLPIDLTVFWWRRSKGIDSITKKLISQSERIDDLIISEKIKLVDIKIAKVENKYYKNRGSENLLLKLILSDQFMRLYMSKVIKENTQNLELDYNILSAFSSDPEKQETSCLNIKFSPTIDDKIKNQILNMAKDNIEDTGFKKILFEYNPN